MLVRRQSAVIEIFPYRYYKPTYVTLAAVLQLRHLSVMNEEPTSWSKQILRVIPSVETCMKYLRCRGFARSDDVHITHADIVRIVNFLGKPMDKV